MTLVFERWLLCHIEQQSRKFPKCEDCEEYLKKYYIPNYDKNDCQLLEKYIKKENILQALNENCKEQGRVFKQCFIPDK